MKFKVPFLLFSGATVALFLSQCSLTQKKQPMVMAPRTNLQHQGLPPANPGAVSGAKNYTQANVNGPYIAITFDDGPHGALTPRLLDILAQRNVKATFYVVGELVKRQPALMRRMAAAGHEFGNHTWTHPKNPGSWADAPLRNEIQRTADVILATSGMAPRSYRPPGGSVSPHQRQWLFSDYGYPTILWWCDPEDWKRPGPAVVTSRLLNGWAKSPGVKPGAILLAHDIHPGTVDAMPATLDALLARGYRFLTISQLLGVTGQMAANAEPPQVLTMKFSPGSY